MGLVHIKSSSRISDLWRQRLVGLVITFHNSRVTDCRDQLTLIAVINASSSWSPRHFNVVSWTDVLVHLACAVEKPVEDHRLPVRKRLFSGPQSSNGAARLHTSLLRQQQVIQVVKSIHVHTQVMVCQPARAYYYPQHSPTVFRHGGATVSLRLRETLLSPRISPFQIFVW